MAIPTALLLLALNGTGSGGERNIPGLLAKLGTPGVEIVGRKGDVVRLVGPDRTAYRAYLRKDSALAMIVSNRDRGTSPRKDLHPFKNEVDARKRLEELVLKFAPSAGLRFDRKSPVLDSVSGTASVTFEYYERGYLIIDGGVWGHLSLDLKSGTVVNLQMPNPKPLCGAVPPKMIGRDRAAEIAFGRPTPKSKKIDEKLGWMNVEPGRPKALVYHFSTGQFTCAVTASGRRIDFVRK